jgi:aminopeptidase-like protein
MNILDNNRTYLNQNPFCEPQLGKRGLYHALGGQPDLKNRELAMFWILNLSDGTNTLLEIADQAAMPFEMMQEIAQLLAEHRLLKCCVQ